MQCGNSQKGRGEPSWLEVVFYHLYYDSLRAAWPPTGDILWQSRNMGAELPHQLWEGGCGHAARVNIVILVNILKHVDDFGEFVFSFSQTFQMFRLVSTGFDSFATPPEPPKTKINFVFAESNCR